MYKYTTLSYGYTNCWLKSLIKEYNYGDIQPQYVRLHRYLHL